MDTLSQFVIGILVSVVCWVLWAMTLLSLPPYISSGGGFMSLTPDLSFARSAFYGLIVGIAHLSVNVTLIYLWEVDSILGTLVSSILAIEILIILGILIGIIVLFRKQKQQLALGGKLAPRPRFHLLVFAWMAFMGWWISILTALLIIPSIIVGVAARLFV